VTLASVPLTRLFRVARGWAPLAGWTILSILLAVTARGQVGGADRLLRGIFGAAVVPLVSYGVVSAAVGGGGLRRAIRGAVALGASPARAALAVVGSAMLVSSVLCATLAAAVCALAHGPGDPPLGPDVLASFGVALTGAAAYAAFFCAGSAVLESGALRSVLLVVDWVVGAGGGLGAVVLPRGHLASLLGGAPCFELSRRASSVALLAIAAAYGGLALALARRRR